MNRMLKTTKVTRTDTEAIRADSRTSLEQMISLLQGGHVAALADVGLTSLNTEQLASLRRLAFHQAELCVERRRLLQCPKHQPADVRASTAQIAMLEQERQHWVTLAENAHYYQQHPDVTAKISAGSGDP